MDAILVRVKYMVLVDFQGFFFLSFQIVNTQLKLLATICRDDLKGQ